MAISGPRYLVLETAVVGGQWTTDLASKPNCYLSDDLAEARVRELTEQALRQGQPRTFRVHRSNGVSPLTTTVVQAHRGA